jgi:hypothetical protein
LRDFRCHANAETIEKALTGSYRAEDLFALKVSACDVRIEAVLKELRIDRGRRSGSLPSSRRRTDQPNGLGFDIRAALFPLLGNGPNCSCRSPSTSLTNTSIRRKRCPFGIMSSSETRRKGSLGHDRFAPSSPNLLILFDQESWFPAALNPFFDSIDPKATSEYRSRYR